MIAHRGLYDNKKGIPENSIPAFKEALEKNMSIELDVHLLRDGNIVVFHDHDLVRMTGVNKLLVDCTYEELQKLSLNNTKYKIPLLKDVLKLVKGKVLLIIEMKNDAPVGKLEEELAKLLDKYKGSFVLESFDPRKLKWFRKNRPDYMVGLLLTGYKNKGKRNFKTRLWNIFLKPDFLACNKNLFPSFVLSKIRRKIPIIIWTIRDKKELNEVMIYGDSFIINKEVLEDNV